MTQKPWGHETIVAKTNKYVVKEIFVNPNSRLSLQYHNVKDETMFLVSGEAWLETQFYDEQYGLVTKSEKMFKLVPYSIPCTTIHRLFTENSEALVVEVSSTELDDVVRIEDDYGRTE